jgi:hypothetical protein
MFGSCFSVKNMGTSFHKHFKWIPGPRSGNRKNITAIPELLSLLDIKGAVATIDDMGAQKKIVRQIVAAKGDYILSLKENQGALNMRWTFARHSVTDYYH